MVILLIGPMFENLWHCQLAYPTAGILTLQNYGKVKTWTLRSNIWPTITQFTVISVIHPTLAK